MSLATTNLVFDAILHIQMFSYDLNMLCKLPEIKCLGSYQDAATGITCVEFFAWPCHNQGLSLSKRSVCQSFIFLKNKPGVLRPHADTWPWYTATKMIQYHNLAVEVQCMLKIIIIIAHNLSIQPLIPHQDPAKTFHILTDFILL